jgi:AcrR family transcriptional regulator
MSISEAPGPPPTPGVPSRRERLRAATMAEILLIGRRLLVEEGPAAVTLRAIAREMGMTAAALYRYVDSHEDLMVAIAVDFHDELTASLEAARDAAADDPLPWQLLIVSRQFRLWALAHPVEFQLVFTNPLPNLLKPCDGPLEAAGQRFGLVFADLFMGLVQEGYVRVPDPSDVDAGLIAALSVSASIDIGLPLPLQAVFVECWTRLYGAVAMEVFGQLQWALYDSEAIFELTMRQLAERLGISDYYAPPPATS